MGRIAPLTPANSPFVRSRATSKPVVDCGHITNQFGGSHAQRDVIDWTLTEAAVRGGLTDLADALAHERLALKPHSPINRAFLIRARAQVS